MVTRAVSAGVGLATSPSNPRSNIEYVDLQVDEYLRNNRRTPWESFALLGSVLSHEIHEVAVASIYTLEYMELLNLWILTA